MTHSMYEEKKNMDAFMKAFFVSEDIEVYFKCILKLQAWVAEGFWSTIVNFKH